VLWHTCRQVDSTQANKQEVYRQVSRQAWRVPRSGTHAQLPVAPLYLHTPWLLSRPYGRESAGQGGGGPGYCGCRDSGSGSGSDSDEPQVRSPVLACAGSCCAWAKAGSSQHVHAHRTYTHNVLESNMIDVTGCSQVCWQPCAALTPPCLFQ
jgi:hypothetical protein